MVVEKGLGDHDPDLKDQISDHIPPQATCGAPARHYYNTCWHPGVSEVLLVVYQNRFLIAPTTSTDGVV